MMRLFRGRDNSSSDDSPQPFSPSPSLAPPVTCPARPIRLVYCDEKGKFRMDPEAVAALQLVKGPVGVVSVCGRARQGKSFILNQLLGRSSGFQVASTHRPCTKGLWLWSTPLKRVALDGTEFNLLLLDSEGIDAYDQTGTYSTQIFSLAVLLSSMFIYNQMGGIDEAALDRLSLVTQMTKHIRVRASGGRTSASELGQFSPIFVWLLRDFYLDLVEENRRITPRDYLELALRPVQGGGKDIASKNEIRDSIRALFPDRECFTLVRPLNNESDLQRLDQISLDKLRPEFRSGLDALTKFVFERTRPKQVGATVMTGPILVGITESYLEALNNGAVPTISSSWQSVEEAECRRAFDSATEVYKSSFDRSKPAEEAALRESHEEAVQKSLAMFNAGAVGAGSTRKKYEEFLQKFFRKEFEDYKRNAYMEADLQCSNAIQSMEKRLRAACHASDANIDNVVKVLDALLSEYEASSHGPGKWQKLAVFLQQSLEGQVLDLSKKLIDQVRSEKSSLVLKCRSIEDRMGLLNKQLEASEKYKSEYLRRYEDAIIDKKKLADEYMSRITNLQGNCSSLEERSSSLMKALDSAKQESLDWRRKYDQIISKQKAGEDQASSEIAVLKSRSSAAEARLAAAREQAQSAQEEAEEWKRKYDIAVREAKAALEKAAVVQERTNKQTQQREDDIREEFSSSLAEKDEEVKDKAAKLEYAEQCLTTLKLELKVAESKVESYDAELSSLRFELKELNEKLDGVNDEAKSFEREARILEQEKIHLEQKYISEFKRFDEVQERCKIAEREAKRAIEVADKARAEAGTAQKDKNEMQRLAMERLAQIERAERQIENLDRQKNDLAHEIERTRISEMDALSKVALLEARVEAREKEIESLLTSNNEQRSTTVQALQSLLDSERAAHVEASNRAEALSLQLQAAQAKIDMLQQEFTKVRLNETALDSRLKTVSHGKRPRVEDFEMGVESVQDMETSDKILRENKKSRSTTSPLKYVHPEDGGSVFRGNEDNDSQQTNQEDYMKFTIQKLKQELTKHNFGAELLQLRNPNKKDILALYEKCVLQKS
ncbi:guanylate-binding protein 1-like [Juglans microcarpa x Juglans regia]|uniref:guanylate-binding protein 1-like n=1 Tax=Juglans microcarpa x Juglans regia TaxID=2249226 RepID=UPI001B7E527C|nr:guanylate-binding protein 1-like [Juglans microcarpa x Juglans regia]